MTTKSSAFISFPKAIVFLLCITNGFVNFTTCDAQSVVSKWKCISIKYFYTTEGSKSLGKKITETQMSTIGSVVIEYKSDHTFIRKTSFINDSKVNTFVGTWNLTGDQLKFTVDPKYNPGKGHESNTSTILIKDNTMIVKDNSPNEFVSKTETTFTRM